MNLHVPYSRRVATTQAAEGLPRMCFSIEDVERMVEAGIIAENDRVELIGGELVPMSPKGVPHETVKKELLRFWMKRLPDDVDALPETTFRIGPHEYREPDLIFWPRDLGVRGLTPTTAMLVVEISDSSLAYDLGRKAKFYASIGIREYWVINAMTLVTRVHREPKGEAFAQIDEHTREALITPALIPALAVRLADLGLAPMNE